METNEYAFISSDTSTSAKQGNKFGLHGIGTKLFLFFFISIVSVVTIVGGISYVVSKQAMEKKVSEVFEQSLLQTTEKLDYLLNFYENISLLSQFKLTDRKLDVSQ